MTTTIITETEPTFHPAVARLIGQMRRVEREASQARGSFNLFGLFEHEDTAGRWDVVVSASWLKPGYEGILTITNYISNILTPEDAVLVARVVPLPPQSDFVRAVNRLSRNTDGGFISTGPLMLGSIEIAHGYILVSQAEPVRARPVE